MSTADIDAYYNNHPEGTFHKGTSTNATVTYVKTINNGNSSPWNPVSSMYSLFTDQMGQSWGNVWTCQWQVSQVSRFMKAGYLDASGEGLFDACLDFSTSQGSPDWMKKQWTGEGTCSSWDSCCTEVGLKPGSKQVSNSCGRL
jgi:hypothetical protein